MNCIVSSLNPPCALDLYLYTPPDHDTNTINETQAWIVRTPTTYSAYHHSSFTSSNQPYIPLTERTNYYLHQTPIPIHNCYDSPYQFCDVIHSTQRTQLLHLQTEPTKKRTKTTTDCFKQISDTKPCFHCLHQHVLQ